MTQKDPINYVVIHNRRHMEEVIPLHKPANTFLCLPPRSPSYMGVGVIWGFLEYIRTRHPDWQGRLAVDCGEQAGHAMGALRHGVKLCFFSGDTESFEKLQSMAEQEDARVIHESLEAHLGEEITFPSPPWRAQKA